MSIYKTLKALTVPIVSCGITFHGTLYAFYNYWKLKDNTMPNKNGKGPKGQGLKDGHGKGQGSGQDQGTEQGQGSMTGGKKGIKSYLKKDTEHEKETFQPDK